jgi:hypothetical protein
MTQGAARRPHSQRFPQAPQPEFAGAVACMTNGITYLDNTMQVPKKTQDTMIPGEKLPLEAWLGVVIGGKVGTPTPGLDDSKTG